MATSKKSKAKPKAKATAKAVSAKPKKGNDALHNLFLAGIGLADETNIKLHKTFNELVKKGKVKEPHVKKAVEDIRKKAMARGKELEKKFHDFVKKNDLEKTKNELLKKKDELMKSKEVKDLRKKIEELRSQVREAAKKAMAKPAAPKSKPASPRTEDDGPAAGSSVTPSAQGVSVNTPVAEETTSTQQ